MGPALLPILGEPVSPSTVSEIAKQLDQAVQAYHQRALLDQYEVIVFDGIVMKRKTGIGAQRRTMLVALGIKADGKKELSTSVKPRGIAIRLGRIFEHLDNGVLKEKP